MYSHDKIGLPLNYFIKLKPQPSPSLSPNVFPIFRLPLDLQLLVFEHCDELTFF